MNVIVIGAGIIGVTTAYELAREGHEVTVLEQRDSVASEASFACAGLVAPGLAARWPAPGLRIKALGSLFRGAPPLRLSLPGAMAQLPWLWNAWQDCRPQAHPERHAALWRLGQLSRERLQQLTHELRLDFQLSPGLLVLLRGERELLAAQRGLAMLQSLGVAAELVDAARCRELEPALPAQTALRAGLLLPQDSVGNCRHFAHLLRLEAQALGARFRFGCEVRALRAPKPVMLDIAGAQPLRADAVVLCTGARSPALLSGLGLRLPMATLHGYSITAPLRHLDGQPDLGPQRAVFDERHGVSITRLGDRLRVAGLAEFGGRIDRMSSAALGTLYHVLDDWYPGAAHTQTAQSWKGARPTLPDGLPVLGASGLPGVWLNLGHADRGWTLACGSASVLAELVSQRAAPLDLTGLTRERLH
jgi:D-amino-acid dehydrogenase